MKFRLARHTNRLAQLTDFYINLMGLDLLGQFKNHSGYDGVFIGKANSDWHLEFTQTTEPVHHIFDEDDILVFYPGVQSEYDSLLERIASHNIATVKAKNPYWQVNGITIKDPDGHSIVISWLKLKNEN